MTILKKYCKVTPEGKVHSDMMVGAPSGFSFIAVQKLATAESDSIDSKTKGINLNIAQPHEIHAMTRQPSTWSSDECY